MKENKAYFYSAVLICLCLTLGTDGIAQGKDIQKTYAWNYKVNQDVRFTFTNYDCDLVIHTWDKNEIEYKMTVDATLRSEEDAKRLDGYIEGLEFSHSPGSAEFNNRYWQSRKNLMGKKTIDLKGEKTIRYTRYNMSGELWVPAECRLVLNSKYSGIDLEDIQGSLSLDLYNDKVFGGHVRNSLKIAAKYSSLELKEVGDMEAELYNTDVEAGNIGNLSVESKYSKFRVGNAGLVAINSYSDKYAFARTGDVTFVNKYSELKTEASGNMTLDCYSTTLELGKVENIELKSKYGKYEVDELGNLHSSSSYSDNYKIGVLKTLNLDESKYGTYRIEQLSSSLLLKEGYSDKFFITETGPGFKGMKVHGKYIKVESALDANLSFRFNARVKYPKFDIDEEAMDVRIKILESSQLDMKATKGTESEDMAEFQINGYDVNLNFTYY
jgi:hypothetical protein